MQIEKLVGLIEEKLPQKTAMEGDRIGLQIQSDKEEISKILVTLEITDDVIDEAVSHHCQCIITFHPLIYRPLINIKNDDRVGRLVSKIIKNEISLISVHTTFDAFQEGTNKILADRLGLNITSILVPDPEIEGRGMGVICQTNRQLTEDELLKRVSDACMSPVKFTRGKSKKINNIAVVGGSGGSFLSDALASGCDAFITADISYHTFHAVKGQMMIVDPGHYEMEQFVAAGIARLLKDSIDNEEIDEIIVSRSYTNPVEYYPNTNKYYDLQRNFLK